MKLLLDENLPKKLRWEFGSEHEVYTIRNMGWLGKQNGELLGLMIFKGFDALITMDKKLVYQQNLSRTTIKFIVLNAPHNKYSVLLPFVEKLKNILGNLPDRQVIEIEID